MKLRNSCSIMDNKLTFALYGKNWQLGLQCTISPDEEDADLDDVDVEIECVGVIPLEDQEYVLIWVDSCADLIVENEGHVSGMDIHAMLREMLMEGLNL